MYVAKWMVNWIVHLYFLIFFVLLMAHLIPKRVGTSPILLHASEIKITYTHFSVILRLCFI